MVPSFIGLENVMSWRIPPLPNSRDLPLAYRRQAHEGEKEVRAFGVNWKWRTTSLPTRREYSS